MSYYVNITGTTAANVERIEVPSGIQTTALPDKIVVARVNGSLIDPRLGAISATDINGTYIKTDASIGSVGAPRSGTFNYYRVGTGLIPDGAFYFCAPLNLSIAGSESPRNMWTLAFASDPRINYLQNTLGTDSNAFPTSGWTVAAPDGSNDNFLGSVNPLVMQITATYPQARVSGTLGNFSQYTNIRKIEMPSNEFRGSFPSVTGCTLLTHINVSGNQLTGSFPSLATNTALTNLLISSNGFSGEFPVISQLTALEEINVSSNQFAGALPTLPKSELLASVNFSNNLFTGSPVSLNSDTIVESFETGLPTDYSSVTSFVLSSGTWTAPALMVRSQNANAVSGTFSLQLKSDAAAYIQSPTLPDGVGVIEFYASSSAAASMRVDISTNGGATFAQTGAIISLGLTPTRQVFAVNSETVTHVRLVRVTGLPRVDLLRITANTQLKTVDYNTNRLTGNVPSLLFAPKLEKVDYSNNLLTGVSPDFAVFSTLLKLYLQNNQLPVSAVDQVLAALAFAGGSGASRVLDISGNAQPSAAGLVNKQTLINRGWNVISA